MITVIDLSSDDEAPIQKEISIVATNTTTTTQKQRNQQRLGQRCQISSPKSKGNKNDNSCSNLIDGNENELIDGNENQLIDGNENEFIDHVVMIWLNRVQSGYKNLKMPDNILKAKAKEAAIVLGTVYKFSANNWLIEFQQKFKKMQEQKQTIDTGNSNVFRIEQIIREEKPKFFKNLGSNNSNGISLDDKAVKSIEEENLTKRLREFEDNQQKQLSKMLEDQMKHLEKVKEAQRQQMQQINEAHKQRDENLKKQEGMTFKIAEPRRKAIVPPASATKLRFGVLRKPEEMKNTEAMGAKTLPTSESVTLFEVIEVDDVLDEPIQSYEEALDCLTLVENYCLSTRNLKAVMFISQIEGFLKKQINS